MKKIVLLASGVLSLSACMKSGDDNGNQVTQVGFPSQVVINEQGSAGAITTTIDYKIAGDRLLGWTEMKVDNGTKTEKTYEIKYKDGEQVIDQVTIKATGVADKVYVYDFTGPTINKISLKDTNQYIEYHYQQRLDRKTVVNGTVTKTFSYEYNANAVFITVSDGKNSELMSYTLNNDGMVGVFEKIPYVGSVLNKEQRSYCTYTSYDTKHSNIYSGRLFQWLTEIDQIEHYDAYGSHLMDSMIHSAFYPLTSYTKHFYNNNLSPDYNDLGNGTRTFDYQYDGNRLKSMTYKIDGKVKATYTYNY